MMKRILTLGFAVALARAPFAVRYGLAFSYLYQGQVDPALDALQTYLAEYKDSGAAQGFPEVFIWNSIARVTLENGRLDAAMKAYEKGYESVPGSSLPEDQKQVWRGRLQHGRCRVLAKMGKREEAWDAALEVKKMIDDGGEAGKQPAQDGMSPGTPVQESAAVVSTLLDRLHGIAANNTITVPEALPQQSQKAQRLFDIVMGAIARISPFVGGNRDHEHHAAAAACARRRRRPPSLGRVPRAIRQAGARQLRRWHRERRDLIVREDLRNLSRIQLLSHVEELVELLVLRAGGILSYSALREDPQVALDSVRLWVGHLERLYFLYRLRRYAPRLPRALRRDPKFYLWDWSEIADPGVRLENMVAGHLLKWCHFSQDWGPPAPRPEAGAPRGFSRRPRLW